MGCAYLRLNQPEPAVQALQQSKQIDDTVTAVHFQLGLARRDWEHFDDAITEFETIVRFETEHPSAHYQLSQLYSGGARGGCAREMQKHQEIQAKTPGGLSSPSHVRAPAIHAAADCLRPGATRPRGVPVRFIDATAGAFSRPRIITDRWR